MSDEPLMLASAASGQTITLTPAGTPQGDGLNVTYTTFDTNKPKTYGNQMYVWQTAGPVIPWNQQPIAVTPIESDVYNATQMVSFEYRLDLGYTIGYAVGNSPNDCCASLFLPPQAAPGSSTALSISLGQYTGTFVQIAYSGLTNYDPTVSKNWVGIWQAERAGYDGNPIAKSDVTYPQSSGEAFIYTNINRNTTYSIGYFMTALPTGKTTLAAQVSFRTA